ncbi:hypothetical protein L3X38_007865 [Prunus dulcis]|uniref:Uncharacterized protein n=1 Tax=Prunus dulcis TaxID=3755 RepID=A0AAD4ZVC7_PRUDU|nr:hypothetical protein L3X38_007865 [Prunus dulcis]
MNCVHFCNRSEILFIVHTILLSEAPSHQSCLVSFNRSIGVKLGFVDPSTAHSLLSFGELNNTPSIVIIKSLQLFLHCLSLHYLKSCILEALRIMSAINRTKEGSMTRWELVIRYKVGDGMLGIVCDIVLQPRRSHIGLRLRVVLEASTLLWSL